MQIDGLMGASHPARWIDGSEWDGAGGVGWDGHVAGGVEVGCDETGKLKMRLYRPRHTSTTSG